MPIEGDTSFVEDVDDSGKHLVQPGANCRAEQIGNEMISIFRGFRAVANRDATIVASAELRIVERRTTH